MAPCLPVAAACQPDRNASNSERDFRLSLRSRHVAILAMAREASQ